MWLRCVAERLPADNLQGSPAAHTGRTTGLGKDGGIPVVCQCTVRRVGVLRQYWPGVQNRPETARFQGRTPAPIRRTACLACLYPEPPANWKREFPVLSAVSSTVGSLAAMEAIKLLANFGEPLAGRLLTFDLRDMSFRTIAIARRQGCAVCGGTGEHRRLQPG